MRISVILVIFNARNYIKTVFDAIFNQTYPDLEIIAVINGDEDGSENLIRQNYPKVEIINPKENLWFSAGNNLGIAHSKGQLIQLVNQDLVLKNDYIEKLSEALLADPKAAAASGKLLRYDFKNNRPTSVIDSAGIQMASSGRGRDIGQLQPDHGQFDEKKEVFAVSGAGPMYKREALEMVKYCGQEKCEYFDEDFEAYWEDVDLSWRLTKAGFKNIYVPKAVAFHGRRAGQSSGGYLHLVNFIRHHRKIPLRIKQLNYKNHIFMYLKNSRWLHPAFIIREMAMFVYLMLFEPKTLAVLPEMFRQWPGMIKKRKAFKYAHKQANN